jgi:hypothetical protein
MSAMSVCLLLYSLNATSSPHPGPSRQVTPICSWIGSDSMQAKPLLARCDREEEWYAVWAKHLGRESSGPPWAPQIDFNRCSVLAVFTGEGSSPLGVMLREVIEEKELVRVRYWPLTQQRAGGSFAPSNDETKKSVTYSRKLEANPYLFVLIPRTTKPFVLEEGYFSNGLLTEPMAWKEKTRLEVKK